MADKLADPDVRTEARFTVVGLAVRGDPGTAFGALWDEFGERREEFDRIRGSEEAYGVSYDFDREAGEMTYLAGVPADDDVDEPDGATTVSIPEGTYAVFTATLADVGETMDGIHHRWLPESDYERGDGPEFERYGVDFDPRDVDSTFEVCVPVVEP